METKKRQDVESYVMIDKEFNVVRMDSNFIIDYLDAVEEDVLEDISDKVANLDLLDSECVRYMKHPKQKECSFWISGGLAIMIAAGFLNTKKHFKYFMLISAIIHEYLEDYPDVLIEFNQIERVYKWGGFHYAHLLFNLPNLFAMHGEKLGDAVMAQGVNLGVTMFEGRQYPLDVTRFLVAKLENKKFLKGTLMAVVFGKEVLFNVENLSKCLSYDSVDDFLADINKSKLSSYLFEATAAEVEKMSLGVKFSVPTFINSSGLSLFILQNKAIFSNAFSDWLGNEILDLIN